MLVWSRTAGLDHSYWYDEILTLVTYVRGGLGPIFVGTYIPNNHQLFSFLGWATVSLTGTDSEVVLRLWSVVPFIAGVVVVTSWLHVRIGPAPGILYLALATLNPMLLDLSRQARGYGLAFFAMSALTISALEARRSSRGLWVVAFSAAGVVGTWTLPVFGIAFVATAGVLVVERGLRRRLGIAMAVAAACIAAWYVPHAGDLLTNSHQEFGAPIPPLGIVTAPIDQILLPSFVIDGVAAAGPAWLVVSAAVLVLVAGSPLLRNRTDALIVLSGVAATLVVVWVTRLYLVPRFVSYLLVPLFMLLATGIARLSRPLSIRSAPAKLIALTLVAVTVVQFGSVIGDVTRLPREANKDAARLVEREAPPGSVVLAYLHNPVNLEVYTSRHVVVLDAGSAATAVCTARRPVVYVTQPNFVEPVTIPCLRRPGTRHVRLEQYASGGYTDVWFVPGHRTS